MNDEDWGRDAVWRYAMRYPRCNSPASMPAESVKVVIGRNFDPAPEILQRQHTARFVELEKSNAAFGIKAFFRECAARLRMVTQ